MDAPQYRTIPGVDGSFFDCAPMRATLTTESCKRNWTEAQTAARDAAHHLSRCRGCALGAKHAGVDPGTVAPRPGKICCRCREQSARLIWGTLCPSCYNRQAEFEKGRNAKGAFPTLFQPLRPVLLAISEGGKTRAVKFTVRDAVEAALRALRHAKGPVLIGVAPNWLPEVRELLKENGRAWVPEIHDETRAPARPRRELLGAC